jgi:hypothetical protein
MARGQFHQLVFLDEVSDSLRDEFASLFIQPSDEVSVEVGTGLRLPALRPVEVHDVVRIAPQIGPLDESR